MGPQIYTLTTALSVGGWVGLDGLVDYWGGLPARRRSPITVLATAAGTWNSQPLSHESNALTNRLPW